MESEYVIADRAYDSRQFRESIIGNGTTPVIPPRSNRRELPSYDEYLYRERHLVECFIGKIKHYRHIFFPFLKVNRFAAVHLGAVWHRPYEGPRRGGAGSWERRLDGYADDRW